MKEEKGTARTNRGSSSRCRTSTCHDKLDALMGCIGGIALIATALSAFFPGRAEAAWFARPGVEHARASGR